MVSPNEDPPFDGGAQPVKERPPEVPTAGRSAGQWVVVIVGALVVLAAVLYLFARMGGG
jgi:hypothetical protein